MSFWSIVKPYARIRRGPVRDEAFKAYVRTFRCCCGCGRWPSEAAHTGHDGGMAEKAGDRSCIPLYWECHREFDSGTQEAFERNHGISVAEIVRELNARYDAEPKRKGAGREVRVLESQTGRVA